MSELVEFVLKLKEDLAGLKRFSSASQKTFADFGWQIDRTQKSLANVAKGYKIDLDISSVKNAHREIDGLNGKLKGLSMWDMAKGSFLGSMAIGGIGMGIGKAIELGKEGLHWGMEFQKNIVGLSTFTGDKEAYNIVNRVAREGVYTPYTTDQLLPIERGLIAMNLSPDRAHRDTWSLANAVAATGGSDWALERMGWHMQQAAGQGFIDGRIMREFSMAGIPINKLLQNSLPQLQGLSQAKAMEKLDNMTLSYDMVSGALYRASQKGGMFADAMGRLSQTIPGKWSTFIDKMQIAGWKITESQEQNIKQFEDNLISFADSLPAIASSFAGDFNKAFERTNEIIPPLSRFAEELAGVLRPIKDLGLSKELADFVKSISGLGTTISKELKDAVRQLAEGAKWGLGGAAKELNYYQSGWDLLQRIRPFHNKQDKYGSGLLNVMGNGGAFAHDLNVLSFGLIKDQYATANVNPWKTLMKGLSHPTNDWSAFAKARFGGLDIVKPGKEKDNNRILGETADAIVNGGKKVVNITFRNFTEHFTIQAANIKDGVDKSEAWFKEMWLRTIRTVPS